MAENSKIEWTDHTFNPWIGCTKVSPGCKNCYAEAWANRYPDRWAGTWGAQGTRIRTSDTNWKKPLTWNTKAHSIATVQKGFKYRVFCGSLCDVFEDRPRLEPMRDELFSLIDRTPYLNWLLLTKRPENIRRLWPWGWYDDQFTWPNIWIGTSVENQEQADKRIPELLKIPAAVRFLSCEPLLGEINLWKFGGEEGFQTLYDYRGTYPMYQMLGWPNKPLVRRPGIDWVIVGGESGPDRRPFNPDWARDIRDQCQAAGVPFFMKQWDKIKPIPEDLMIRQFPDR